MSEHEVQIEYSEEFRRECLEITGKIMNQMLAEHGMEKLHYILRCMMASFYGTALSHGCPLDVVLSEFDFFNLEIKERIKMFANGELQPGEIGP